jgi:hypothetical protein
VKFCKHGNDLSDHVQGGKFLDLLIDYGRLKSDVTVANGSLTKLAGHFGSS